MFVCVFSHYVFGVILLFLPSSASSFFFLCFCFCFFLVSFFLFVCFFFFFFFFIFFLTHTHTLVSVLYKNSRARIPPTHARAHRYPREWDYKRMRALADSCGALLMCDMAHISGLVAGGVVDSPFEVREFGLAVGVWVGFFVCIDCFVTFCGSCYCFCLLLYLWYALILSLCLLLVHIRVLFSRIHFEMLNSQPSPPMSLFAPSYFPPDPTFTKTKHKHKHQTPNTNTNT